VHLATVRAAAVAAQQSAVAVDLGDHAHTAGAIEEGDLDAVGALLGARIGSFAKTLCLVMLNDDAIVLLDDDAIAGLFDHLDAARFDALLASLLHLIETLGSG
jgi:hypothetical protein